MRTTSTIAGTARTAVRHSAFYTPPENMRRKSLPLGPKDPGPSKTNQFHFETEVSLSLDKRLVFSRSFHLQFLSESEFFKKMEICAPGDSHHSRHFYSVGYFVHRSWRLGIQ